jgi:hypothetical protein
MGESGDFPEGTEENLEESEGLPSAQPPLQPIPPTAPTGYVSCPVCGETVSSKGRYVHFRNAHTQLDYNEYKDKFTPVMPPARREEAPPKPIEVETIEEAISFVKERLQGVHGVGSNDRLIISALNDDPTPLRDPNLLHAFIKSLAPKAYDSHLSTFVIRPLYVKFPNLPGMVDRFLSNIQLAQPQPPPQYPYFVPYQPYQPHPQYTLPPQPTYQQPLYPQSPQQQPTYQYPAYPTAPQAPQYPQVGPTLTPPQPQYIPPPTTAPERYIDERIRSLEERLTRLVEERLKTKEEGFIEIEEPVRDKDGNCILDESGRAIVKKMKVPASQAALYTKTEDAELKALEKLRMYKEIFAGKWGEALQGPAITKEDIKATIMEVLEEKERKLTPEQVVELVEQKLTEKLTKPEEPEELKALRAELAENKKKLDELKETLTQKEKEALENRIQSLESEIRRVEAAAAGRVVEGYRADEYRLIGQGLEKLASVAEKKEPVRIIIEKLPEITSVAAGAVPQGQASPQARVGLLEMLRQRGLTTPQ